MKWLATLLILGAAMSSSRGFNYSYNSTPNPEHWSFAVPDPAISTNVFDQNIHAIRFYLGSDGYSTTNTAAELNALRNSFGQWESVPNTLIRFEDAGFAPPGYDINTSDNSNVVYWAKSSTIVNGGLDDISGALGVNYSSYTLPDNEIRQFDIVLNGVEDAWFTDFNDKTNPNYFVEGTATHEIGHALGLAHAAIGGATLLWVGSTGVDTQAGLSPDEMAFARSLYPSGSVLATLGNLRGTVTKDGSPVLGAAVILEGTNGNLAGGTCSLADGSYSLPAVPPGTYNVRVVPLDPATASDWLINGQDISGNDFANADTSFQPTANQAVTLLAGATNTLNIAVVNGDPAFRITWIRQPTVSGGYYIFQTPVTLSPGQSNYTVGVFSDTLPTNNATFAISGDGLTLSAPTFLPGRDFGLGHLLNGITATVGVSSNATPGLRTFTVTQGTNRACANGYLEILPLVADYNFDGLDDVFQRQYFFPFTSANAKPGADPDGDGMNNLAEYIAGTVPTNAASLLKLQGVTMANGNATITWQSVTGKHYQVLANSNLAAGAWQNLGAPIVATNISAQLTDPGPTNATRFYRVQVIP